LKGTISLHEYLQNETKDSITVVHQFKLALKLVLAVLQYHSTPWLGEEWRISQLQLMPSKATNSDDVPLYLNSRLPQRSSIQLLETSKIGDVQMKDGKDSQLSDAQRRGIYNTTLFCLGMALLEIGYWKSVTELAEDNELDSVDTVRMLAENTVGLGKRYDEMVNKCLRCDFAFGTDLNKVELQQAIWNEVVCPLEELIDRLDNLSM
jgi:hypothetical protein